MSDQLNAKDLPIAVAITGASGVQYGLRLVQWLVQHQIPVYLMISKAAQVVIATETSLKLPGTSERQRQTLCEYYQLNPEFLHIFGREQWLAPLASGSGRWQALVVCPCSTGTLSAIAQGAANTLIERAADVALKERKPLILVPREAPYSQIHLTNMLSVTQMGGVVLPASPGFYHQPKTISDLIDFLVARILNQLNLTHSLMPSWGQPSSAC